MMCQSKSLNLLMFVPFDKKADYENYLQRKKVIARRNCVRRLFKISASLGEVTSMATEVS